MSDGQSSVCRDCGHLRSEHRPWVRYVVDTKTGQFDTCDREPDIAETSGRETGSAKAEPVACFVIHIYEPSEETRKWTGDLHNGKDKHLARAMAPALGLVLDMLRAALPVELGDWHE